MPVGELLARTSSRELAEWCAFEQEYGPLGPERGDWQAATVAYVAAISAAGKKGRRLKITDFLLRWGGGARKRKTPAEMLNVFRAVQTAQAATQEKP